MAKCWYCKTSKGKRYCTPIDNVLCPVCCGENRLKNIDCNENCRHLKGVAYQKGREEEKEFSELMQKVPHGQYDDIFKDFEVASMAFAIESFIRDVYMDGRIRITDNSVFESYKKIYQIYYKGEIFNGNKSDNLTGNLLQLFEINIAQWEKNMDKHRISRVILRLMLSVKNMSGGNLGEFGYLNYLKNNLDANNLGDELTLEDMFGNITTPGSQKNE